MPIWKIFYDDKKSFSNEDGMPNEALSEGVLLIVQKGDIKEGQHILNGGEYYYFENNLWHMSQTVPDKIYIKGRLTDQITWRNAKQEAIKYAEC